MTTIKQRILKERGLVRVDKRNRKRNSFEGHRIAPKAIIAGKGKTPLMRYLEQKYNVAIEEALVSGSLSVVAKKFGNEVDVSTEGCQHATPACNGGVCHILMELEEWDLMLLKRQQILDGTKPL